MLTLCLWYLAPTPQCLSVTPKSGNFSWIGGGGRSILWLLDAGRAMELHLSSRANRRA